MQNTAVTDKISLWSMIFGLMMLTFFLLSPRTGMAEDAMVKPAMDLPPVVTAAAGTQMPQTKDATHPLIRLTPDDTQLIKLEQDAGMIIVGNPVHANVIADSTRTLVVVPRQPGSTFFTVLTQQGDILMRRLIIVAGPQEQYVRVRNACALGDDSCVAQNVFYCPDTCHEILLSTEPTSVVEFQVPVESETDPIATLTDKEFFDFGGGLFNSGSSDDDDDEENEDAEDENVGDEPS